MGWIIEAVIDWLAIDVIERLWKRLSAWGCAVLLAVPIVIAALIWLAYLNGFYGQFRS